MRMFRSFGMMNTVHTYVMTPVKKKTKRGDFDHGRHQNRGQAEFDQLSLAS